VLVCSLHASLPHPDCEDALMAKRAADRGADFEAEIQKALTLLQARFQFAFERKYDTKSAGAFMPAQPSDFMAEYCGQHVLIECKSSEVCMSMNRKFCTDNLRDAQVAQMRIWMRAGSKAFYLFKHWPTGMITLWPAEEIIHAHLTPRYSPDPEKIIVSWVSPHDVDTAKILLMNCFSPEDSTHVANRFH